MTARILKILALVMTAIALVALMPGNDPSTQAQPMNRVTSLAPQGEEEGPKSDALGNSDGEFSVKPNNIVETETADLIFSCSSPVAGNNGLTWDGSNLWISDFETKKAYKVNPSTCESISSIPLPGAYPMGLAWDGSYLWHAEGSGETIYQLNPSTGEIVFSFSSPGGFPTGLAWDGSWLWNADCNCTSSDCVPDEIHKLTTGGSLIATFPAIGELPTGLTHDGHHLWQSDNVSDTIYKLDPVTLAILDSFPSPGSFPNDLAWDGQYLWVVDNGTDMLYQYKVTEYVFLPLVLRSN